MIIIAPAYIDCIILRLTARLTKHSDDGDGDYDYDDDFIVPDDSEDDVASRSSRASKRSSRQSLSSGYEDDEVGTQSTKSKKSAAAAGRPSLKQTHGASGSASASTSNFLTAAERRAQATKEDKKSQEDPFSFLSDVRDVGCIIIIFEASVDPYDFFCRKTVSDQDSPVMIPGHYMSLKRLGMTSVLSRNKCARRYLRLLLHMTEHIYSSGKSSRITSIQLRVPYTLLL